VRPQHPKSDPEAAPSARAAAQPLVPSFPSVDTAAMNAGLAEIARNVAPGAHAVRVVDGAGRDGSRTLAVPDDIPLLPFPRCSPGRERPATSARRPACHQ